MCDQKDTQKNRDLQSSQITSGNSENQADQLCFILLIQKMTPSREKTAPNLTLFCNICDFSDLKNHFTFIAIYRPGN